VSNVRNALLDELARHFRARLGEDLVGVVLYGSRARGDARPDSDLDLMIIADRLPEDGFDRAFTVRPPRGNFTDPEVSVRALTPAEYERDIAPIDLDVAIDAVVLYDRDGYVTDRLALIRRRIDEAGLYRDAGMWRWRRWPERADWSVTWEGVRL
jgi:predicted nucleotidyltransferase